MSLDKACVVGGGAWGTTLALLLAEKGHAVGFWVFEKEVADAVNARRENPVYLPGVLLPDRIRATGSYEEALADARCVIFVVPSHAARSIVNGCAPFISPGTPVVSATKGIENTTLMLVTDIFRDVLSAAHHGDFMALSGPSFAKEVCQHLPTAVSLAATDPGAARRVQSLLTTPAFKVYTTPDLVGVQAGGALKNVVALAAGGADGLGFGHNTRAALITRGLREIMKIGVAMGADPKTFFGLSGMGDLVLTCTGELSRNRTVGFRIGRGEKLDQILREMKSVAEGVNTARSALALARRYGIELPIIEEVHKVLFDDKDPRKAVQDLMERAPKEEWGGAS